MKNLLFLLFTALTFVSVYSQDVITKKSGEDIQAKILEVNASEIKYKKFDNQNGPVFTLLKSDVLMIRYENGSKDIFNDSNSYFNVDLCSQGQLDSKQNYLGERSGAGWTCATTILLTPLFGLIPGGICASVEPSEKNLEIVKPELMKDPNYSRCYKEQAHKTKKRKIWTNYGIGSGIWLVIILLSSIK